RLVWYVSSLGDAGSRRVPLNTNPPRRAPTAGSRSTPELFIPPPSSPAHTPPRSACARRAPRTGHGSPPSRRSGSAGVTSLEVSIYQACSGTAGSVATITGAHGTSGPHSLAGF